MIIWVVFSFSFRQKKEIKWIKKKQTVFNAKWLEEEDFKSLLTSWELSNMDRQALISPCNRKKDQENVKIKSFFRPVNNSLVNPVKASEKETVLV